MVDGITGSEALGVMEQEGYTATGLGSDGEKISDERLLWCVEVYVG